MSEFGSDIRMIHSPTIACEVCGIEWTYRLDLRNGERSELQLSPCGHIRVSGVMYGGLTKGDK